MKVALALACILASAAAQFPGRGDKGPKCADGSKPTFTCSNGVVVTRPKFNPCGDRTKPTPSCADGSTPKRKPPCDDGSRPTCADGNFPVCSDGSSPSPSSFPPCSD